MILLAAPGVNGMEVLIEQNKAILSKMNYSKEQIDEQVQKIRSRDASMGLQGKWFKCFLDLEPKDYLSRLSIPVLALGGEKDLQVVASQNLSANLKAGRKSTLQSLVSSKPQSPFPRVRKRIARRVLLNRTNHFAKGIGDNERLY